ncbi:MAG: hypothetical protein Q7R41_03495, partial [Phycisphaerales bacterium]|nr:hypothetical protein [Phycisphaerales bacterium]
MLKKTVLLFSAFLALFSACWADVVITLGDKQRVTSLYSYPNTTHWDQTLKQTVPDQTLEETVAVWLNPSLVRDGLPTAKAEISLVGTSYIARLTGDTDAALETFRINYEAFLAVGDKGLDLTNAFIKKNPDKYD